MGIYDETNIEFCDFAEDYANWLFEWNWELFCAFSFNHHVDF